MSNETDFLVFQGKIEKYNCKCEKLDVFYNKADHRNWSAILNKGKENIIVTLSVNKYEYGDLYFDILTSTKTMLDTDPEDIYQILEPLIEKTIQ